MKRMKPVSRIAQLREQAELTQLELSQLLDVTENTVANWEKGRSSLEWIERVIKLCRLFNCTPEDLIEYVPDTEPVEMKKKGRSLAELRRLLNTHEPSQTNSSRQTSKSSTLKAHE
ncbi:MAG: helix-turn-helix transcriptional regulator [Symploca sp. SIO2D2]|nr:helix-turn-helix transcriptional regulator [Symploca sp. SIO2D2]